MNVLSFLLNLPAILGVHLAAIFGLIFIDFMLAVGAAVRAKVFQWRKLSDFYRTNVIPFGLAYIGLSGGMQLIAPELLPAPIGDTLAQLVSWFSFATIAGQIVFGSIVLNAKALVAGVTKWELSWKEGLSKSVESMASGESGAAPSVTPGPAVRVVPDEPEPLSIPRED